MKGSSLLWKISFLILFAALVAAGGCHPGNSLTKANVDAVTEGMSRKQVESILGTPTSTDTTDMLVMKKTTYIYKQNQGTVTIVFNDDKVQSKESTLPQ